MVDSYLRLYLTLVKMQFKIISTDINLLYSSLLIEAVI